MFLQEAYRFESWIFYRSRGGRRCFNTRSGKKANLFRLSMSALFLQTHNYLIASTDKLPYVCFH